MGWGAERLRHLFKVTQLIQVSGRMGFHLNLTLKLKVETFFPSTVRPTVGLVLC